jgi:hypothetical protein
MSRLGQIWAFVALNNCEQLMSNYSRGQTGGGKWGRKKLGEWANVRQEIWAEEMTEQVWTKWGRCEQMQSSSYSLAKQARLKVTPGNNRFVMSFACPKCVHTMVCLWYLMKIQQWCRRQTDTTVSCNDAFSTANFLRGTPNTPLLVFWYLRLRTFRRQI